MGQKNDDVFPALRLSLRNHPKLISTANLLGIPRVYVFGTIVNWWCGAYIHAEDGDMWQGDEERSNRFILSLSEMPEKHEAFLDAIRRDRWLDGWLIHDWLDYMGPHLYAQYKSHGRKRLVEIWEKHGKRYGREKTEGEEGGDGILPGCGGRDVPGMSTGCDRDVDGMKAGYGQLPINPNNPKALNPYTLKEKETKSPKGGVGENDAAASGETEKRAVSNSAGKGLRVQGYPLTQEELQGGGFTHKHVFEAFMPLLVFHAIMTLEAFFDRVKHCRTTPANWIMLFMDKIHAVYRDRDGTTLMDDGETDPVAMTVAGLLPKRGKPVHHPTDAARQLFAEIMMEFDKAQKGGKSRWAGKMSAPTITLELGRRKGKGGRK